MLLYFYIQQGVFPVLIETVLLNIVLFILCMYCQNQLILSKPRNEENLTAFYVVISFGSFIGGLAITWIIPVISTELVEYLIGLIIIAMTLTAKGENVCDRIYYARLVVYFLILIILWPVVFYQYNVWSLIMIFVIVRFVFAEFIKEKHFVTISLIGILCLSQFMGMFWRGERSIYQKRNYYGVLRVVELQHVRTLYHGTTLHGAQSFKAGEESEPMLYYDRGSPIAEIMTSGLFDLKRIGVVGLGVGMAAAYTTEGQILDFYELDEDVFTVADQLFTFTRNAAGTINYIFGDARLSLNKNSAKKYDLLVVDAFGGDAIPIHLLTKEMIAQYKNHLNDRGILMFHISNRYLRLSPILARVAFLFDAHVSHKIGRNRINPELVSTWMVMTWDLDQFKKIVSNSGWNQFNRKKIERYRPWTDQYSSVLPAIKWKVLLASTKRFKPFAW